MSTLMTEEGPGAALTVVQAAAGALHALLLLALFTEFSYKHRRGARAAGRPTQSGGTDGGRGHFGPRLQILAGSLATTAQLLGAVRLHDPSRVHEPHEFALQVTTVLALLPLVIIPLLAPRWYERRGMLVCLLARAMWLVNPNQRSARGIAHVLQAPPVPGPLGLVKDALRLFLAARGITLVFLTVTMPLPLWLHVLASLYAVQRVRTTADLCTSTMLRAPAWVQQIKSTHSAAQGLPLLLERAALPSLDGWPPEARCQVFVAFYQYLLTAVSILVAAKLHPLLYGARDPEPPRTSLGAPYKLLRSGLHAADARLHHMCAMVWGEQGSALSRLAVSWTLLSFLMQLALLLEMHAPLAPTVQLGGT